MSHCSSIKSRIGSKDVQLERYLSQWAKTTSKRGWFNFFEEMLFVLDNSKEAAKLIISRDDSRFGKEADSLEILRAKVNKGRALIILNEKSSALTLLKEAVEEYMFLGRHREVVECFALISIHISDKERWKGRTPVEWCADIAGRSYDSYISGLYYYAAGVSFLRKGREDLVYEFLLIGSGYSKYCGDHITLMNILHELVNYFSRNKDYIHKAECIQEIARIKGLLGICHYDLKLEEASIINEGGLAMKRNIYFCITGEVFLILIISILFGGIFFIFERSVTRVFILIGINFISGILGKLWNVRRRFVNYSQIDRT